MMLMEMMMSFGMRNSIKSIKDDLTVILDKMVLASVELRCIVCSGSRVWMDGFGPRKSRIPVQRYECGDCGKKFCTNTFAAWYRRIVFCCYHSYVSYAFS